MLPSWDSLRLPDANLHFIFKLFNTLGVVPVISLNSFFIFDLVKSFSSVLDKRKSFFLAKFRQNRKQKTLKTLILRVLFIFKVRIIVLEPTRLAAPDPKSGMSTNFTISAKCGCKYT